MINLPEMYSSKPTVDSFFFFLRKCKFLLTKLSVYMMAALKCGLKF